MISEKIFELILRNGMTQKEFSEETGISQSTISDWKRKGTNPSADKILKICEVLKVTPYELLGENETERNAGNPEMSAGNETEKIILEGFRNLSDRKKNESWDIWQHCRRIKMKQKPSYLPKKYKYSARSGNLKAEAVGVVKGEKHFPVFEGDVVFKPLTKSKPLSTPLFALC